MDTKNNFRDLKAKTWSTLLRHDLPRPREQSCNFAPGFFVMNERGGPAIPGHFLVEVLRLIDTTVCAIPYRCLINLWSSVSKWMDTQHYRVTFHRPYQYNCYASTMIHVLLQRTIDGSIFIYFSQMSQCLPKWPTLYDPEVLQPFNTEPSTDANGTADHRDRAKLLSRNLTTILIKFTWKKSDATRTDNLLHHLHIRQTFHFGLATLHSHQGIF